MHSWMKTMTKLRNDGKAIESDDFQKKKKNTGFIGIDRRI